MSAPRGHANKAAGTPGMMLSKDSFFLPGRGPNGGKVAMPVPAPAAPQQFGRFSHYAPQRRFVYDKGTGEADAEWIDGVAVCIHTGQELFRSRGFQQGDGLCGSCAPSTGPFDYSVPKQRHPNDFSISTDDIVASGFLTLDAFKAPHGAAIRLADYERFLEDKRRRQSAD